MSYANGTPFLNLAQTIGTDHRDWFDENAAKLDLDTKMKTLWDGASDTATILASLQESVASLDTDVSTLQGVVSGHTSTITTINESLVLINTALNALNTQVTNKFDSAGIADPYDATYGIYSVGDVVTYNGQRYVCDTAVTAAEPFDVSKWSAEDIQTVIDHINTALAGDSLVYGDLILPARIGIGGTKIIGYLNIEKVIPSNINVTSLPQPRFPPKCATSGITDTWRQMWNNVNSIVYTILDYNVYAIS